MGAALGGLIINKWSVIAFGILFLLFFGGLDFLLDNPVMFIFIGLIVVMWGRK